jgi:hypothetical protein
MPIDKSKLLLPWEKHFINPWSVSIRRLYIKNVNIAYIYHPRRDTRSDCVWHIYGSTGNHRMNGNTKRLSKAITDADNALVKLGWVLMDEKLLAML